MKTGPDILIVAGEASGDAHAARILCALKRRFPGAEAWGFGGEALKAEGLEIREHVRDLSVMGFAEVMRRYGYFRKIFRKLVEETRRRKPDLILLVDYPGFNLRFARAVRDTGIPVVQYVCPQVWAWKRSRIPKMAKVLDRLICIFPFEPALFADVDLDARYCGHPLVEETEGVRADPDWKEGVPRLVLAPGSRSQEIERLFPVMWETALRVREQFPRVQVRVSAADADRERQMRSLAAERGWETPDFLRGRMRELVKGAEVALVTSGTATLETALLGTPMLVVYKTSALTYAIGRQLVKVPHIGMVNLVAEREVCPEFIQDAATAGAMADAVTPLLQETPGRARMREGLADVRSRLVSDERAEKVVDALEDFLRSAEAGPEVKTKTEEEGWVLKIGHHKRQNT